MKITVTLIRDDLSEFNIVIPDAINIWFNYGKVPDVMIETSTPNPDLNKYGVAHWASYMGNVYSLKQEDVENIQLHS